MAPRPKSKRPSAKRATAKPRRAVIRQRSIVSRFGVNKQHPVGARLTVAKPPTTNTIRAVGPLRSIEFISNVGRRVTFKFTTPKPRLVYNRKTDRLWIVGGSYTVTGRGLVNNGSPSRAPRVSMARSLRRPDVRKQYDVFVEHHEGVTPREVLRVSMPEPKRLIDLGEIVAISYDIDRGDGDGTSKPWRHEFVAEPGVALRGARHIRPRLKVTLTGRNLIISGGSYKISSAWLGG